MMRCSWRTAAVVVLAGALAPRGAAGQTGFNGVITFVNERGAAGKQDTFVQYTQGRKIRLEGFGPHSGAVIMDNEAKVMMMVDPEKKQYMTMTDEDAKQMQAMMGPMMERMKQQSKADAGKLKFSKTGKTETVAGIPCEVWHGEYTEEDGKKDEGDACVATGVGLALSDLTFDNPMMRGGPAHAQLEQYRQLVGGNKGILKASTIKDGKVSVALEAIKVERKTLGNDVFAPPAGYKEIRMGEMMMQAHKAMQMHQNPPGQDRKPEDTTGKPEDAGKPQQ